MTDAQKISIGMRVINAILWMTYIALLVAFMPSLLTALGVAIWTYILTSFKGVAVFSKTKNEVYELVQMAEFMMIATNAKIAILENEIISLGGAVLSKDEPALK